MKGFLGHLSLAFLDGGFIGTPKQGPISQKEMGLCFLWVQKILRILFWRKEKP